MEADEFEDFLDSLATAVEVDSSQASVGQPQDIRGDKNTQESESTRAAETNDSQANEQEKQQSSQQPDAVLNKDLPVCDERTILSNPRQQDNPLIKHLTRAVVVEFTDDIKADFVFGRGQCGIFLSLKYHNLYPTYIYDKMRAIGDGYPLKVLIVLIDITEPRVPLKELTKFCINVNSTLMACWSFEEAARYVESYKLYRHKSPEILMPKQLANSKGTEGSYECVAEALASVKRVNRTDAVSLISTFGSLEKIARTSIEGLSAVPGLGPQKAEHLNRLFRRPFMRS